MKEAEAVGISFSFLFILSLGITLLVVYCRYKSKGDNEGFISYINDSLSDAWSTISSASTTHTHTSLQFLEDEESAHSTHPMMNDVKLKSSSSDRMSTSSSNGDRTSGAGIDTSSSSADKSSSGKTASVTRLSSGSRSPASSLPSKSSKSRVQLAGMSTAKRQGYASPSLSDL